MDCLKQSSRCLAYDCRNWNDGCRLHHWGGAGCLLKQYCKEQALFCSIGVCVLVLLSICAYLSPIAEQIQALFLKTELDVQYLELLWKSIGICYLTSIAADLCRDTGETAMASVAELWGRVTLLILFLPMAKSLLELMTGVLQ